MAENVTPTPESIREARTEAGLTQSAAAALITSTLRTWQDWEHGKRTMQPALWRLWRHVAGIEQIPFRARK